MTTLPLCRAAALAALMLVGTFSTACDRDDDSAATPDPAVAAAEVGEDTAAIFIAPEASSDEPVVAVYTDLTRYDWYARGEPLVHEGRAYQPGGSLVAATAAAMEHAGEYGGVAYYRAAGEGPGTLYVPVFTRYWLAFRLQDRAPTS